MAEPSVGPEPRSGLATMVALTRRGLVNAFVTASAVSFTHTFANRAEYHRLLVAGRLPPQSCPAVDVARLSRTG